MSYKTTEILSSNRKFIWQFGRMDSNLHRKKNSEVFLSVFKDSFHFNTDSFDQDSFSWYFAPGSVVESNPYPDPDLGHRKSFKIFCSLDPDHNQ